MININNKHKDLIIIGAGGHAKVCIDVAEDVGLWENIYLLDDNREDEILGKKIIGTTSKIVELTENYDYFVGIGDNTARKFLINLLEKNNKNIVNLIHSKSLISKYASINGFANLVMPGVVVNADAKIGKGNILNTSSIIEHDCILADYNHISPGAILLGNVEIQDNVWIGSNSTVHPNIQIGDDVIIGALSFVTRNIDKSGTYTGIPVKVK